MYMENLLLIKLFAKFLEGRIWCSLDSEKLTTFLDVYHIESPGHGS